MKLISHRGNVFGPNPQRENTESYILEALELGYDCEIDVWIINNTLWLGHDQPEIQTSNTFLSNHKDRLWIHCKNHHALQYAIVNHYNCFFHDKDAYTLTSHGFIWGNIDSIILPNMICVMPEKYNEIPFLQPCYGICSDFISHYTE